MSDKAERQKRKAYLNTLLSLRSWALVGSSVMAIWTIRHPNMLIRWARRGFGVWSAWRLVKATIRQQQLR
ncbi:MAG: YqjK family protein [Enterobacter sp.]|nr:YqjK family protein [Enterobacter sp.]